MEHARGPYAPRMGVLSSVCRRWVEKVELVVLHEEKQTTRCGKEKITAFLYLLPSRAVLTCTPALATHFIHDLHLVAKHLLLVPTQPATHRGSIQRDSASTPTSATRVSVGPATATTCAFARIDHEPGGRMVARATNHRRRA